MLGRCPGVDQAVVVAHGLEADRRLIAYVRAHTPASNTHADTIRRFTAQKLPPQMVPTRIRYVATFPLLPNGKVDRASLGSNSSIALASDDGDADV